MTDVLLIVGPEDGEAELVDEVARRRPGRVTVLVEDGKADLASDDSESGRALRDRLAALLQAIESRTGAVVVGLAGSKDQLRGWRFDRTIGRRTPLTV